MRQLLIILITLCFSLSFYAQNQKKLALVIGNSNYLDANSVLKNPENDAQLMGSTFNTLEFDSVIVALDLTYDQMRKSFSNYKRLLRSDFEIGFIYYSGHGTQDEYKTSYLIPIDFPKDPSIDDLEEKGYDMSSFITSLERIEDKVNVIILDACRNNPFDKSWKGKSITSNGLSEPENPPNGVLIHYSTRAGFTASDNSDRNNSIYTETLANIMLEPNLKIEEIFKKVRGIVRMETESEQSPQLYGEYDGDLYLLLKKDYSKIEVNELNKEAKNDVENGMVESAIKKYQILQNYFESSMHNIDKRKLLNVYLDLGNIYWSMTENAESYREYDDFRLRSSNAFFNATQLLEAEGIYSKEEKTIYSEALYKFLRVQSYIDFEQNDLALNDSLINEYDVAISKLIDFNITNFGENNYRTGCANYLKGILFNDYNSYTALDALSKSSKIFFQAKYDKEELTKYAFIDYIDLYSCKWNTMVLSDMLRYAYDNYETENDISGYIDDLSNNNLNSLKENQVQIINNGVRLSELTNYNDYEGILSAAASFHDNYSLYANAINTDSYSSEDFVDDTFTAIEYRERILSHNSIMGSVNYIDSIDNFMSYARQLNNLSFLDPPFGKYDDQMENYKIMSFKKYSKAFTIAKNNQDPIWEIYAITPILQKYYYSEIEDTLYTYDYIDSSLNEINKSIDDLLYSSTDKDDLKDYSTTLKNYFYWSEWLSYKGKISDEVYLHIIDQKINSESITHGYGNQTKMEAMLDKSSLLNNMGLYQEAKQVNKDALDYLKKHNTSWSLNVDDQEYFNDINEYIIYYQSKTYNQYMDDIIGEYLDEYPQVDIKVKEDASLFVEKNKDVLLELKTYHSLKLSIIKARIFLNWNQDEVFIDLCDEALAIIDGLIVKEDFSDITRRNLEDFQNNFHNYKLVKNSDTDSHIQYCFDFINSAKKWQERVSLFPILESYEEIIYAYRWEDNNYKKYKSLAKKAYQYGDDFLLKDDFSYWMYPQNVKKQLMLQMKGFLVNLTEHIVNPTNQERQNTIDLCISIIEFIEQNKNKKYVFDPEEIYSLTNTISDQYYWMGNHEKSLEYNLKNLDLVREYSSDSVFIDNEEIQMLKWINDKFCEDINDDNMGMKYYKEYLKAVSYLNDTLDYTCKIIQKKYGSCTVPYVSIKMNLNNSLIPSIEFDIDRNEIVNELDKRYYVRSDTVVVEKMSKISIDFGGYKYSGIDKDGLEHDTTSYLFFDKGNIISSNSYVVKREDPNNSENVNWEFLIPEHELKFDDLNQYNFIVNLISYDQSYYTLSRIYNKNPYPPMSKFKEFESVYSESLYLDE